ncbi:hypothetical protein [Microbacterium deminutum]|uniref:hypothetical protein n=1 Tax=Microbacterium deminutum TaxID=344164 RepID=UPI0031CE72DD
MCSIAKKAVIIFTGLAKPAQMASEMTIIAELAAAGTLVPVTGATYPMDHSAAAYQQVLGRKVCSTVITFTSHTA